MLQANLTADLDKIEPGRAQYTHLLDADDASVLDDIIVWWLGEDRFDVMPNASNTGRRGRPPSAGSDVTPTGPSSPCRGPEARDRVARRSPTSAAVGSCEMDLDGVAVTVAGTGYTGEDGVEVAVPAEHAVAVWDAVLAAGVSPAGLGARDTLRLEAGLPLHGHELGPGITPLQAGLGWVVGWDKGDFRGRAALEAERAAGPSRRLRGLAAGRQAPAPGGPVGGRRRRRRRRRHQRQLLAHAGPGHRPGLRPPRHRARRPAGRRRAGSPRARRGRHPTLLDRSTVIPPFAHRHIGPDDAEIEAMLATVGVASLDALVDAAVPASIRQDTRLALPEAGTEEEILTRLRAYADRNQVAVSMLGMGYSGTLTPTVILRNVMENPAWYTAYTPYQPEISQGRLEALLNFQTMITDLTGMDLANASLLDEATAAAEAMALCRRVTKRDSATFFVDAECHPQTIEVVATRAEPLGIKVIVGDPVDRPRRHRRLRRARPVPGHQRRHPGPDPDRRAGPRAGRPGGRGRRPAGPDPARGPRRGRGRRRGRLQPALRRAPGLRRPARRLHGRAGGPRPLPAGSSGRRLGGRGRSPRPPAGPADPGAAHPQGEGHQQHLHGPGPVGRDGLDVRRVPRARRPDGHRRAGPRAGRAAGRRPGRGGHRPRARALLRHRDRGGPRPGGRRRGRGGGAGDQPAPARRRPGRHRRGRDDDAGPRGGGLGRLRRGGDLRGRDGRVGPAGRPASGPAPS